MQITVVRKGVQVNADGWQHRLYSVTLRHDRRRMTVPYMRGMGLPDDDPSIGEVMHSLCWEALAFDGADNFEDWVSDFDGGEATYKQVAKQAKGLRRLLGDSYAETVERYQEES